MNLSKALPTLHLPHTPHPTPQAVRTKAIGNHTNLSKALPTLHQLLHEQLA
ncbi:MAG: hypothetical protein F6K65_32440 [Moorea sp. SIO3C2]|nr:hypothetical protein [Moorena sp. SIO3C2]